eukprot:CAMPEP_0184696392 /NCGR_PEP_ID=MMETSP0313-20130426/3708_1 /TAXON_ID=2792 /ORGANISM="Porphyridium aerugineum, Strain SAG 1380-2" /LENGTH=528 /DNA_ID=CAMNT_0027155017 /DNA_START=327 /DNA_END=1913 /DNA_ORIENTATION=-
MAKRDEEVPYIVALTTYYSYAMLILIGYIRDMFGKMFKPSEYRRHRKGYAPLLEGFEDFYTRRLYLRIQDCWARPIASKPGAWIDVIHREFGDGKVASSKELVLKPDYSHCLNLGSYNYLGYGEVPGGVDEQVFSTLESHGVALGASAIESVPCEVVAKLERTVATFLGKEDAIVSGMGFATNAQLIPAVVGPGCLIMSDSLNHASIVVGARSSGAKISVFEHNDPESLEVELREAILEGQPNGEPWKKILIIVEGIYSMEGEVCPLPEIVVIKKKYGAYLYLDEAHSIGALGATGRGVTEYHGVSTADVDIMMGTFTKSFGSVGGYIASSKELINRIRYTSGGSVNAYPMSPVCARHTQWVFDQLEGKDGSDIGKRKIRALRENAIYLRERLNQMGMMTYGTYDSPVIPVMLFNPAKIAAFSHECLKRQVAVVVVGFPATSLMMSRARFCVSAAHTKEDLDMALQVIDEVGELLQLKYCRPFDPWSLLPAFGPSKSKAMPIHAKDCIGNGEEHDGCNGICHADVVKS